MLGSDLGTDLLSDRPTERFYWRLVENVLVVIDLPTLEFTILNKTAGAIWLSLLDEYWSASELVTFVSDNFATGIHSLEADVTTLLEQWDSLGWLETDNTGKIKIPTMTMAVVPPPYKRTSNSKLKSAVSRTTLEWSRTMDFVGKTVTVNFYCDPELLKSDVSNRAKAFLNGLPKSTGITDTMDCINCFVSQDGIYLRLGGACVEAIDVSDGLSRLVLWCFYQAYGRDNFIGTFHAAALGRDEGAILMPGLSGAGKSTLTAFLARNGWLYGGDDIIGLSKPQGPKNDYHVLPFCSAVSVKDGSLEILSTLYPNLKDLPVVQYDTKSARFPCVPVADQMTPNLDSRKIRAIVFPAHGVTSKTDLISLTTEDALLSLVGVGFRTGETMNAELLSDLFQFLEKTPKFRLEFSSIDEARQRLESLL